jgi:hypothetical protein
MECYQHPGTAAAAMCVGCRQPICSACKGEAGGHPMCKNCLGQNQAQFGGEVLAAAGARGTSVVDSNGDIKSQVLHCLPTYIEFLRANPKDYPKLNLPEIERYTQAFKDLGFQGLAAYTPKTNAKELSTGYARLLVHPVHQCLAEVNQGFPAQGDPVPVRGVIMSAMEHGWLLSTTDRKADGTTWMLRRPKSLWVSLPDAPAAALLERHLRDRDRICQRLGVKVLEDVSLQAHCQREVDDSLVRRQVIQGKSLWGGIMDLITFKYFPKSEWWGDLNKAARKG